MRPSFDHEYIFNYRLTMSQPYEDNSMLPVGSAQQPECRRYLILKSIEGVKTL